MKEPAPGGGGRESPARQPRTPSAGHEEAARPQAPESGLLQRARAAPATLSPAHVLQLQRTIGNRAVGRLLGRAAGPAAVQRTQHWKAANHKDKLLDPFTAALDAAVQKAAATALEPDDIPDLDGYTALWKDTAAILRAVAAKEIDRDDSDAVAEANAATRFASARYGYAVESLACSEAVALTAALADGCSYQLQASRGMTRPDIVVTHRVDGEIGWFDITSEGSIGHIDSKTGSGWKVRPYVAEITYPPLDTSRIGTGKLSIAEGVAMRNATKRRAAKWEALLNGFRKEFDKQWENEDGEEKNKQGKQALARSIVGNILGTEVPTPEVTKSVLRALAWSPLDRGFDKGGTKAQGEEILRTHYGV